MSEYSQAPYDHTSRTLSQIVQASYLTLSRIRGRYTLIFIVLIHLPKELKTLSRLFMKPVFPLSLELFY
jgi:hypothetical protein